MQDPASDVLLGHVMMSSLDVLLVIDEKGIIQLVSRSIDRVFGWTPDELVGKNVSCLMPQPHRSQHDGYLDTYRETGETTILGQTREFDAMRKDGSLFPCELTVWGVELPDRQGPAFSGIIRDISARRQLEQERHNYIDRLEQTQRSLELQAEELRNAQEAAEAASRAKSWFLANMSHEIRTPMTAIIGYAELMQETLSDEFDVESAETIVRNGKHLLSLINDILDLSKIEAEQLQIECIETNPCQIVAEVASLMRVRALQKGVELKVDYVGAIPETIKSDPTRLRQVLVNLVGNAVKFTEQGIVRLRLKSLLDGEDAGCLHFQITDTGIGMTEEVIANLFQPFTQADPSTTRRYGGTGLGLTISQRIAELLGGRISVESSPGVGSTFTLELPTSSLEQTQCLEIPSELGPAQSEPSACAGDKSIGSRVLLAEDGIDNQRLITLLLRKSGCEVLATENGRLAIEQVKQAEADGRPFDVILMDMQMPVLDGYSATRELRAMGIATPIIALTAHAMSEDRDKCLAAGCSDFATKPITRERLFELVRTWASQARTTKAT